jgi:hypothetical protein
MTCVLVVLAAALVLFALALAINAIGWVVSADAYLRTAMLVVASVLFYSLLAMAICTWRK